MELTIDAIKKLDPKKDEIIVVRTSNIPSGPEMCHWAAQLREQGIDSLLLFVDDESDIYVLDEGMMARFEWVKKTCPST